MRSLPIQSCCSFVSTDRVAVVTIDRSGSEKQQGNSSTIRLRPDRPTSDAVNWQVEFFFICPTKPSTGPARPDFEISPMAWASGLVLVVRKQA